MILIFSLISAPFVQSGKKSSNDPAQVINIMKSTNFCEILSLLYGILIHETDSNGNPTNCSIAENGGTITLHEKTYVIVNNSMILLNSIALLDLDTFQVRFRSTKKKRKFSIVEICFRFKTTLGEETMSLQLRHVANYLLAYCNQHQSAMNDTLLHRSILLIGYYSVLNQDNQVNKRWKEKGFVRF